MNNHEVDSNVQFSKRAQRKFKKTKQNNYYYLQISFKIAFIKMRITYKKSSIRW